MKKLKDKIIHMLGGMTEEDVRIMTRPVRCGISRFSMETLRIHQIVSAETIRTYPEYMDKVHNNMTYRIADKMIEGNLVEFVSKEESPESIIITATARIFKPEA